MASNVSEWFKSLSFNLGPNRPGTMHHYICFGKMHAKIGTLIIIILRLALILAMLFKFLWHDFWYNQVVDAFFIVVEVLTVIMLVYAFIKEDSRYMWPFMAIEFTGLVFILILYSMAVTTIFWPRGPYALIVTRKHPNPDDLEAPGEIRIEALKYAAKMMFMALYVIWELRVLLACNRYFDDLKQRKHEVINRPIINEQIASTRIDMEPTTANGSSNQDGAKEPMHKDSTKSFNNPNFSLSDSEDEDLWPQRKIPTNNPALS